GVGDQREGQTLLGNEILMRLQGVARHPDNAGTGSQKLFMVIAKALRLGGAPGRAVLGIEIQDRLAALERFQRDFALGGNRREGRNELTKRDLHYSVSCGGMSATMTRRPSAMSML